MRGPATSGWTGLAVGLLILGLFALPGSPPAQSAMGSGDAGSGALGGPRPDEAQVVATGSLRGRIFGADGKPQAGASLSIVGSGIWPVQTVLSDGQGFFVVPRVPEGIYEVHARFDNAASSVARGIEFAEGEVRLLHLRLREGRRVDGSVVAQGTLQPIAGARVFIGADTVDPLLRSMRTDASGRFAFDGVVEDQMFVWATHADYLSTTPQTLGEDETLRIELSRAASIAGRVFDEHDQPLTDVRVTALTQAMTRAARGGGLGVTDGPVPAISAAGAGLMSTHGPVARTDRAGMFLLNGVPPGRVTVVASAGGYAQASSAQLRTQGGQHIDAIELRLRPAVRLLGRVVDTRGDGIGAASIELRSEGLPLADATASAQDGTFVFEASPGPAVLIARVGELPPVQRRIVVRADQRDEVVVELSGEVMQLEGRVFDQAGFPIEAARIEVRSLRSERPAAGHALSGPDGTFIVQSLPRPPYRLTVEHADYVTGRVERIDEIGRELRLVLEAGQSVDGRLIDDWNDEGIAGAQVHLAGAQGRVADTKTDHDGGFALRNVAIGAYVLTAEHPDYESGQRPVQLVASAGALRRLDPLRLLPAGRVEGEIRDSVGDPAPGAEVTWGVPPRWSRAATTSADGSFALRGVPSGPQVISVRHSAAGSAQDGPVYVRTRESTRGFYLRLPSAVQSESPSE